MNATVMQLVIATLASWRVSVFVVYEDGPFRCGARLRAALVRLGMPVLVSCFHCTSFWISGVLTALMFEWTPHAILIWWAVAGATSALELLVGAGRADLTSGEPVENIPPDSETTP